MGSQDARPRVVTTITGVPLDVLRLRRGADPLSLDHAAYLLRAALAADTKRRWWQLPNRLWVGRVDQALRIVERASAEVLREASRG